ncbi:MAG: tripartite tricarboxylate transporter TctB family protein [Microbacterium gubbeenense]|uniref:tripartite tricarboxylate transporter TctB family protein n=1 Tax=Microbacterium gubbeenense TaxID=159896 RepID=UPI0004272CED|nr:tripartite tricarboxylate transporter TctB family protein [Microbacterium gubbeenense]
MTADDTTEAGEATSPRPSRALEIIAAAIATAFMAGYLVMATQIPLRTEGVGAAMTARTWPSVLGVSGLIVAIILLVVAVTRPVPVRSDIERISAGGPLRVVLTIVISAVFVALWSVQSIIMAGYRIQLFPIVAALYLFALLWVYGHRGWIGLIAYPVGLTAFIYILFGIVLRIPL